jgi:hypothetical protein
MNVEIDRAKSWRPARGAKEVARARILQVSSESFAGPVRAITVTRRIVAGTAWPKMAFRMPQATFLPPRKEA